MPEDLNIQETIPKFCHSCRLFGNCTFFTEFSLKLLFSTYLKNKYFIHFIQIIIALVFHEVEILFEAVKIYVKNRFVNMDVYLIQVFLGVNDFYRDP